MSAKTRYVDIKNLRYTRRSEAIKHSEKSITYFQNEVGPGLLQSNVQKHMGLARIPNN